jgi:hypothetical protein
MEGGVASPGTPSVRTSAGLLRSDPAEGLPQAQVSVGKGVGPPERTEGDVAGRPGADSRELLKAAERVLHVHAGLEPDGPVRYDPGEGPHGFGTASGKANRPDAAQGGFGYHPGPDRKAAESLGKGGRTTPPGGRLTQVVCESSRKRPGSPDADLLAQDRPPAQLEAVHGPGNTKTRPLSDPGCQARV